MMPTKKQEYILEFESISENVEGLSFDDFCALRDGGSDVEDIAYIFSGTEETEDNDGKYNLSARRILFPFSFSDEDRAAFGSVTHCQKCGKAFPGGHFHIDHVVPLAQLFNRAAPGTFEKREQRRAIYFDASNLQPMCLACNSSKGSGGVKYNKQKIAKCRF